MDGWMDGWMDVPSLTVAFSGKGSPGVYPHSVRFTLA